MADLTTLTIIAAGVGIASPIVGWGILLYQNGKVRGATDTEVKADIKVMKGDVETIKKTLGNGGYVGIKQDIQKMQVNCASEMAKVKTELENIKTNRYGDH